MTVRFDGRVAVITGAGSGLGRAHALAFARRGAKVVVNDLGVGVDGRGSSAQAAEEVVEQIRAAGGEAIACAASVSEPAGAARIIETAVETYGRLDILVNNAGFLRDRTFAKQSLEDIEAVLRVHLLGSIYCTHAAWPLFIRQRQGRVVLTTSGSGLYGNHGQSAYAAAKAGMIGLMHSLRQEGQAYNIRVNTIAPAAATRLTETVLGAEVRQVLEPDLVSAGVLYLASDEAPSGVTLVAGGGFFATARMVESSGIRLSDDVSPESVAEAWQAIDDHSDARSYGDVMAEMEHIFAS